MIPDYNFHVEAGLCQCGCGRCTPIAKENDRRKGWVKGQPTRFCYGHRRKKSIAERFWRMVDRSAGPDGCWPWTGRCSAKGYGVVQLSGGRVLAAHRVAEELTHGPIEPGVHVLHRCDNPPCCNPYKCLFRGTNADNVADKIAKGRQPRGEKMAICQPRKLGPALVSLICKRYADGGVTYSGLAREFGVLSHNTIRRAVIGETWSFVGPEGEGE